MVKSLPNGSSQNELLLPASHNTAVLVTGKHCPTTTPGQPHLNVMAVQGVLVQHRQQFPSPLPGWRGGQHG